MLIKFKHFVGTFVLIFLLLGAWAAGKVVTVQIPEQLPECPVRFIRGTLVASDGSIWAVGEKKAFTAFRLGTGHMKNRGLIWIIIPVSPKERISPVSRRTGRGASGRARMTAA